MNYFEIPAKHKIQLVGKYNALVYECNHCDEDISGELYNHIIGFAESNLGIMKVIECPKCFEKWYCHANETDYFIFHWRIKEGTQKHFKS